MTPFAFSSQFMFSTGSTRPRSALTAPFRWNRKMKMSDMAIELVMDGK